MQRCVGVQVPSSAPVIATVSRNRCFYFVLYFPVENYEMLSPDALMAFAEFFFESTAR